jgi:EAL domain-containing protein (putative c-di-GMP-specific phosphodiesterase class I)
VREQLENALERGEFVLWYQPVMDLASGVITSMEALIRWRHPELGLVSPLKFITAAEKSGLIVPIGRWVLNTACQQLAAWQREGHRDLSIAVNVSARQLRSQEFVDTVAEAIERSGIDPRRLELEITESTAMDDFELAKRVLGELADLGVRIAIDDFGAGHSSLLRLKRLPIHTLKIDRFFIQDVVTDERDAAIVAAIIAMAHSLGLTVVAEGIESSDQLNLLRNLKWNPATKLTCEKAQGYILSKPLPADAAGSLLRSAEVEAMQLLATG